MSCEILGRHGFADTEPGWDGARNTANEVRLATAGVLSCGWPMTLQSLSFSALARPRVPIDVREDRSLQLSAAQRIEAWVGVVAGADRGSWLGSGLLEAIRRNVLIVLWIGLFVRIGLPTGPAVDGFGAMLLQQGDASARNCFTPPTQGSPGYSPWGNYVNTAGGESLRRRHRGRFSKTRNNGFAWKRRRLRCLNV